MPGHGAAAALALALALSLSTQAGACYIQGHDSGVCKEPQAFSAEMPFCASSVRYRACVPRETPWFGNLTTVKKDQWVQLTVGSHVLERKAIEMGELRPADPSFYNFWTGEPPEKRFNDNADCINAYKNYMCWLAFPRCSDAGDSLLMCQSACINMMRSCKYPKDMWRCYEPQYYGGLFPEGSQGDQTLDSDGNPVYSRALFPGMPFMPNKFFDGEALPICTPSLTDAATGDSGLARSGAVIAAAAAGVVAVALGLGLGR